MLTGACFGFIVTYRTGNAYLGVWSRRPRRRPVQPAVRLPGRHAAGQPARQRPDAALLRPGPDRPRRRRLTCGKSHRRARPVQNPQCLAASLGRAGPVPGRILTFGLIPCALLVWWLLNRTRWGLSLRTVGESRAAAFAAGLNPQRIQYQALFLGGLLGGIGGAHLSLSYARVWVEGMTPGRGFIAVALVIFASWQPMRAIAGALLFGGGDRLQPATPGAQPGDIAVPARHASLPAHACSCSSPSAGSASTRRHQDSRRCSRGRRRRALTSRRRHWIQIAVTERRDGSLRAPRVTSSASPAAASAASSLIRLRRHGAATVASARITAGCPRGGVNRVRRPLREEAQGRRPARRLDQRQRLQPGDARSG